MTICNNTPSPTSLATNYLCRPTLKNASPHYHKHTNTKFLSMEKLTIEALNQLCPLAVLNHPLVRERFVSKFRTLHSASEADAEVFFEQTKHQMAKIIAGNENLKICTGFSAYGVLLDICAYAMPIENGSRPFMYVTFRNFEDKASKTWLKHMILDLSPYGELSLRISAGQLKYADRPVIVYDGDIFQPMVNEGGRKIVRYQTAIPRKSNKIIGSFIRLERPDGSFDFFWMLPEDVARLKGFSDKNAKRTGGNDLYTSADGGIDPGFLEAKTIKHAFKTFPTIRLGNFSQIQQDEPIQPIDYGLDENVQSHIPAEFSESTPNAAPRPPQNDPFGGAPAIQQTVKITDHSEIF